MSKIQPKKKPTSSEVEKQEELLRELHKEDKKKNVQRVTIDLPQFIYDQIKSETEETGQTIKGFVVGLVRDYFTRKDMS